MYQFARVFNEGIVRARRHDDLGYPLIFIEWDKDHWAYSGEEDGWTLEAHFDLVEEDMQDKNDNDKLNDLLAVLSTLVKDFQVGEPSSDPSADDRDDDGDDGATFDEVLNAAIDDARDSEAFIIIVAHPEDWDGTQIVVPRTYVHSKRADAAMMLDAAMADQAAQAHARLVLRTIERTKRRGPFGS